MRDLTETSLSSEQLVDGVLLSAFRDEVELPDGRVETARTKDDVRALLFRNY